MRHQEIAIEIAHDYFQHIKFNVGYTAVEDFNSNETGKCYRYEAFVEATDDRGFNKKIEFPFYGSNAQRIAEKTLQGLEMAEILETLVVDALRYIQRPEEDNNTRGFTSRETERLLEDMTKFWEGFFRAYEMEGMLEELRIAMINKNYSEGYNGIH